MQTYLVRQSSEESDSFIMMNNEGTIFSISKNNLTEGPHRVKDQIEKLNVSNTKCTDY